MIRLSIHPENPQKKQINAVCECLNDGGVVVLPTDSCYALTTKIGNLDGAARIRQIRKLDDKHRFSLLCQDLSNIATYAKVDNSSFRYMRTYIPGAFTFILQASKEVPKKLLHEKRKEIGIRVPKNNIVHSILNELNCGLLSSTMHLSDNELIMTEADTIEDEIGSQIDMLIDGGSCGLIPTTIVNLTGEVPVVIRQGNGILIS